MADFRIFQSDCLTAFWLIIQEREFSHIRDWCRYKANTMNFYLTPNLEKSNGKIFGKPKKPLGTSNTNMITFMNFLQKAGSVSF